MCQMYKLLKMFNLSVAALTGEGRLTDYVLPVENDHHLLLVTFYV